MAGRHVTLVGPVVGGEADLVSAALGIAVELVAEASDGRDGRTWEADIVAGVADGLPLIGHGDVGPTLYDGAAGIGLALAAAAAPAEAGGLDGRAMAMIARGACDRALADAPALLASGRTGLFDGAAGIALAGVEAGLVLGDEELIGRGRGVATRVGARLRGIGGDGGQPELDVIGGLAGSMLALIRIAAALDDASLLEGIEEAAARIVAAARPDIWGSAWRTTAADPEDPPLLGMGHGAAGIALALAEAAAATGDPALEAVAREGVEYERARFDASRANWPDLRGTGETGAGGWTIAWCHGALGIGMSRLRLGRLWADPLLVAEATAALLSARDLVVEAGSASRAGRETDSTGCHGLAGALELMLVAERALGPDEHRRAARRVGALMVEERRAFGHWTCGLRGAGEVPGLMTGKAGIALALLRAAGAVAVPTPLLPGPAGW